jgi:hypothetical protein
MFRRRGERERWRVRWRQSGEAAEDFLLILGGVAFFLFDLERQADAGEIVGGAGFPAARETAIAGEMEVAGGDRGVPKG